MRYNKQHAIIQKQFCRRTRMLGNTIRREAMFNNTRDKLRESILALLQEKPRTRGELVEILGRPRTSIYDVLKELMRDGLVTSYPVYHSNMKRGRPRVLFDML
ncbi:MAG: helix-turn-helix domain-containing protein [Promethearchaeota archaeon]